jgi:hypothetical protein
MSMKFDGVAPFRRLMSLDRAAIKVLPKLRKLPTLQLIFNLDKQKREKLPGIVAQMLFDGGASFDFPLYGKHLPSEEMERVPPDELDGLMFSDDATFLYDAFEGGFNRDQRPKFVALHIQRCHLKRRLRELGAD